MPPCYNYKKERKMADIILQARDLCKSFSSEGVQNHVLNNMDLDIYKGDFTVIMGASGSGKSSGTSDIMKSTAPSSVMAEATDEWATQGRTNIFG